MKSKSEKIGVFLLVTHKNERGRLIKTVFRDYIPVVHFDIDKPIERKLAAIGLVERGLCNQGVAGKICGFHRNTIRDILKTKQILGLEAVLKDDRGHKKPYKYVNKILSHIKNLLRKNPDWTDEKIADQATQDLAEEISRSAVARIRTENKNIPPMFPSKKELMDEAKMAESIEKEHADERQLWLAFHDEPELKEKADEFSQDPPPQGEGALQRELIEQLQRGKDCCFAGGLMHHLFLEEIGFEELTALFPFQPGAVYQSAGILATLYHMINQGIQSIEALKLVNACEFGVLLGCHRIADKATIRDHLDKMAELNLSSGLIEEFARRLLEKGRIDREVFFIDGHFLPYYGLSVIAKGYFTVRRHAMKGNELYAITDIQGRPLFFITESNEIDFRPIIARSAEMLKDLGITRPVLVFDRGGYGLNFFQELDKDADFVTWSKHLNEKSLQKIPLESFDIGLVCREKKFLVAEKEWTVSESIQTAKKDGRQTPVSMKLRLIVLHDVETERRLGIFTNNTTKPAYDIAYYMLQRWGKSENFFKETMAKFYLNYHPGYDIEELEKQPLVENPDLGITKKAIKVLKSEVQSLEKEILVAEAKFTKRNDKRLTNKIAKLNNTLNEKKGDFYRLEQTLSSLPDKVCILEILKGKAMSRCDLEKKKLYDVMQFMAFHSRERLLEIFRDCYNDKRDIKTVLDMITTTPGIVKLVGNTLMVILRWIESKKHRQAAKKLCRALNQKGISMVGGLNVKLSFHMARFP